MGTVIAFCGKTWSSEVVGGTQSEWMPELELMTVDWEMRGTGVRNRASTEDEFVSSCASRIRIRDHDATELLIGETSQRQLRRWCLALLIRDYLDDEACVSGRIEDEFKGSVRWGDTHNVTRDSDHLAQLKVEAYLQKC